MQRTQIYLDPEQTRRLGELAVAEGTTRSDLIREAVNAYLSAASEPDRRFQRLQQTIRDLAEGPPRPGPTGIEYVRSLRKADRARDQALERRRRGT